MNLALYQITAEHQALARQLAEMDIDDQTIADTLEGNLAPFEDKARAVAAVIGNLAAEAEVYAAHAKRMQDKAKAIAARSESLKAYLLNNMQAVSVSEIKGDGFSIKLQNNPESVEVFQPELIPALFMRVPPVPEAQPDKTSIKEALKAGADIPGARLTRSVRVGIK